MILIYLLDNKLEYATSWDEGLKTLLRLEAMPWVLDLGTRMWLDTPNLAWHLTDTVTIGPGKLWWLGGDDTPWLSATDEGGCRDLTDLYALLDQQNNIEDE